MMQLYGYTLAGTCQCMLGPRAPERRAWTVYGVHARHAGMRCIGCIRLIRHCTGVVWRARVIVTARLLLRLVFASKMLKNVKIKSKLKGENKGFLRQV
jgi:hypothetical protein